MDEDHIIPATSRLIRPSFKKTVIDSWLPGCSAAALVAVAGIYSNTYDAALNVKNGFPVFSTVIEAVSVSKHEDQFEASKLTQEDRDAILALARDPRIGAPRNLFSPKLPREEIHWSSRADFSAAQKWGKNP